MGSLKKPKNPCVGICKIDRSTGWCRGCWRTKAEIKQWKQLSRGARWQLLDALAKRRGLNSPAGLPETERGPAKLLAVSAQASTVSETVAAAPHRLRRTVRHRQNGRLYWELHRGVLRADGTVMVVYRGEDGRIWIRPAEQFDDGRYEQVDDRSDSTRAVPSADGQQPLAGVT